MSAFLAALMPVIILVGVGWGLAWRAVIPTEGWRAIERLAYLLLFPALIIRALARAPFETAPWGLALVLIGAQCCLGALGLTARRWPGMTRPAVGTIIQSNVRWNAFIALSLGSALFGEEGIALVTIAAAAMIPTANVLSVVALTAHAERGGGPGRNGIDAIVRNPLVLACVIGGALAAFDLGIPELVDRPLELLAEATLAVGLLCAGAGTDLGALRRAGGRTLTWSLIRLLGLPGLTIGGAVLSGLSGTPLAIAVITASVPTATNSYVLARQLGGDAPLAANLIAVQTLLAAVTMPAIWVACRAAGLF